MDRDALYQSILDDTRALLQRQAHPRTKTISLLGDTVALLEGLNLDGIAATAPAVTAEEVEAALAELQTAVSTCTRCDLCKTRTQTVFGTGAPRAELVFVGEAPGADEDRLGEPFVGAAGELLTSIIENGMKRSRNEVYICNVLKCRPPGNRDPQPSEVEQCEPYLIRQLELIHPKVICALGRHAAQTLLKTTESIGRLRGKWHDYQGIPLRVTYHPSYLLRKPEEKNKAWEDIKHVMRLLSGEETVG